MWFRLRYFTHRVTWPIDYVITCFFKKSFISTFARTMAINSSNLLLKLSWPQQSSHVTHLSCDNVIFSKRCISSFTTPMTIGLSRIVSKVKGAPPSISSKLSIKWLRTFRESHVSTNARLQNSVGDIKHEKTHKSKAFFC